MPSDREREPPADIHTLRLDRIEWHSFLAIAALHVLCVLAPFTFSWSALGVAVFLWWLVGCFGITMGFHRLFTHRSFETPKFFEYFLAIVGTLAWQGGPIWWVGTHRLHHREADTEFDPHTPRHGFSWAHAFWCLTKDPFDRDVRRLAPDLQKDRFLSLLDRFFFVPQLLLAVPLYALGGWAWVIWGIAVRAVCSYHATWLVNSASHLWGYRNFETREDSRNNWWVALVSWGEGWHNNHHAYQRSARHGMRWFEIDLTYITLRLLCLIGLARNLVLPKPAFGSKSPDA